MTNKERITTCSCSWTEISPGAEKEPSCTVQLVLGVLEKLAKLFLCLRQDHEFGGGQGSPSRVLSHMPAAWSAAEKGPAGQEEGESFPFPMFNHL